MKIFRWWHKKEFHISSHIVLHYDTDLKVQIKYSVIQLLLVLDSEKIANIQPDTVMYMVYSSSLAGMVDKYFNTFLPRNITLSPFLVVHKIMKHKTE